MENKNFLILSESSIKKVPLHTYDEFIFIVNGEQFKTSRIVSDLLSPKVCKIHLSDPTVSQYSINTKYPGDFSLILRLANFERQEYSDDDFLFIKEILENLNNESILYQENPLKITTDNIFELLQKHQKKPEFYLQQIDEEIEFLSSHFHELFEYSEQYKKLQLFNLDIIERIVNNSKLRLIDEDQLLAVINYLYSIDSKYSILYEYVDFKTVSATSMKELISVFDINDINFSTWKSLSQRLGEEVKESEKAPKHGMQKEPTRCESNAEDGFCVRHHSVDPFDISKNDPFYLFTSSRLHENDDDPFADDPFSDGNDSFGDLDVSSGDPFAAVPRQK